MKNQRLDSIKVLLAADMHAVTAMITQVLANSATLIQDVAQHLITAEGKRLRPMMVLLAAGATEQINERHHSLASIVELIHTATLLHDDVVDASRKRRGRDTANTVFGNSTSVLVGDFIYSRTFQMMVTLQDLRVMGIMSETTNTIAHGEVLQLGHIRNMQMRPDDYFQIIYGKTAKLFETATRLGAMDSAFADQLALYGKHLGMAFQLVDDVLDFNGDATCTGKTIGTDLVDGKLTLPMLYALEQANPLDKNLLHQAISDGANVDIGAVLEILHRYGALETTMHIAQQEANMAIDAVQMLADSAYKQALCDMAQFAIDRCY